jgi:hypothetical protein
MTTRIQLRRGSASQWSTVNPTLSSGEVGYETDTNKFKIGNGSTAWSSLDYFGVEVDLSGYLTASSASTTYLTQASASTTYAPIVPSTQTGFRNILINGDMRIDQRKNGGNQSVPGGGGLYTYGPDRWFGYFPASSGFISRQYSSNEYFTRIFTSGINQCILGQRIEAINSYHLAGKTVTLSFRMAAASSSVTWAVSYANTTDTFGTYASPTVTAITSGSVSTTSSFANYSVTFAVPDAATTGLQILFTTGTNLEASLSLTNVQLEAGNVATPFERRPIGTELALCQRYYYQATCLSGGTFINLGYGNANSAFEARISVKVPVSLRTNDPVLTQNSMEAFDGVTGRAVTLTRPGGQLGFDEILVNAAQADGLLTQFRGYTLRTQTLNGFLAFSAEL